MSAGEGVGRAERAAVDGVGHGADAAVGLQGRGSAAHPPCGSLQPAAPASIERLADQVLQALAASDLDAVRRLCAPGVVMFGTDEGERWADLESLCDALGPMRELGLRARWDPAPTIGANWTVGTVIYQSSAGPPVLTRVSLVFEAGLLVHGHFSIEGRMPV